MKHFTCLFLAINFGAFVLCIDSIIRLLHLTDIHFDQYFQPESVIISFCHRKPTNKNDEVSSVLWGRECDSSIELFEMMLVQSKSLLKDAISLILLTGDNIRQE